MSRRALSLTLALAAATAAQGASARAEEYPNSVSMLDHRANSSVLVGMQEAPGPAEGGLALAINPGFAREMRLSVERQYQEKEDREHHSLLSQYERRAWLDRMTRMAHVFMDHVRSQQEKGLGDRLKSVLAQEPAVRRPLEIIVGAVALYTGKPFRFRPHPEVGLTVSSHIARRSGAVQVDSPMGDARLEVNRADRMRVSMSRTIPAGDLSGAVTWLAASNEVVASVSKPIAENVVAVYESRLTREETIRLLYALTF